jgi:hypothetical protein
MATNITPRPLVQGDAVELVQAAMRGRRTVEKRLLFSYGREKGVAKKAIIEAARDLGFKSVHSRRGEPNAWYFRNPANDIKNQMRLVSDAQLDAEAKKHWKPTEKPIYRWEREPPEQDLGQPTSVTVKL